MLQDMKPFVKLLSDNSEVHDIRWEDNRLIHCIDEPSQDKILKAYSRLLKVIDENSVEVDNYENHLLG